MTYGLKSNDAVKLRLLPSNVSKVEHFNFDLREIYKHTMLENIQYF